MIAKRRIGTQLLWAVILTMSVVTVQAQAPLVANAPIPSADFHRSGGVEPDTTAPWRYFPLHVGDAWEYYNYQTGERRRVDVLGEETHNGQHYFTWRSQTYDSNGNGAGSFGPRPVRFDTSTATVRIYFEESDEEWDWFTWPRCPLDVAFGDEIECPERKPPFEVDGSYDGLLVFGGEVPGTGEDTVRTAVKTDYSFDPGNTEDWRCAADIGFVFFEGELGAEGIYYARVNGIEYGQAFYPVADEPGPPDPRAFALSAFPNPFRERLSVTVLSAKPGWLRVELLDVLGRVVQQQEAYGRGVGEQMLPFSGAGLTPGLYVVRVFTEGGERATKKVLKL